MKVCAETVQHQLYEGNNETVSIFDTNTSLHFNDQLTDDGLLTY